jgi:2-dehydro-3-deoxyglucarate aldolase/4-hydroxy-2-oxoheptanedioate aldolase
VESAHRLRETIRSGGVCLGVGVSFNDPTASEILGGAGLDFLWIDMEHTALGLDAVQTHIMAAELQGAAALVRVPANEPVVIKQVLDLGAAGIIVPMVRTAGEARDAVAAARYPPEGIRGWGPRRPSRYGRIPGPAVAEAANRDVLVVIQIEHIDAMRNLDEILSVPGIDAIYFGTGDLAGSMGLPPEAAHPSLDEVIAMIIRTARQRGVCVGQSAEDDVAEALKLIDNGVQMIAVGDDFRLLANSVDRLVHGIRGSGS